MSNHIVEQSAEWAQMGESQTRKIVEPKEYWRNPRAHTQGLDDREQHISSPEAYMSSDADYITSALVGRFRQGGAQEHWSILEIGCNCGRNLKGLYHEGYKNLTGVEINPEAKELSWSFAPEIAERIIVSDAQSYLAMQPTDSFDLIFTQSILMHVPPSDEYLFGQMSRVAKEMIITSEVEFNTPPLKEYKFDRYYNTVFEGLGWKEVLCYVQQARRMRVFVPCQQSE